MVEVGQQGGHVFMRDVLDPGRTANDQSAQILKRRDVGNRLVGEVQLAAERSQRLFAVFAEQGQRGQEKRERRREYVSLIAAEPLLVPLDLHVDQPTAAALVEQVVQRLQVVVVEVVHVQRQAAKAGPPRDQAVDVPPRFVRFVFVDVGEEGTRRRLGKRYLGRTP